MGHDEYLQCSSYENQAAHATEAGFTAFFDEKSQRHFFALLDADGKVLLRSEGYPQINARENGIQSVNKNRKNRDYYEVKEEDGKFFLTLRAANYREIARSCPCDSAAEATELIAFATGEKIRGGKAKRTNDNTEDDYLACRQYDGHGDADENGFTRFQHTNNRYYFSWLDDNGKVKMRSEGYPTAVARDNGMNSVMRNRDIKERYVVKEMMGKQFVILKAANHQEIARSCPKDNLDAVGAFFPILGLGGAAVAAAAAVPSAITASRGIAISAAAAAGAAALAAAVIPPATPSVPTPKPEPEDDYLPCREYHGHMTAPRDGFRIFISQRTGKYYFAVVDQEDDVALRSEGHLTAKERDADLEDVVKNKFTRERYEIKKVGMNHHFIILKNANGKEIGRSCAYDSLNAVYAAAPFLNPAKPDAKVGLGAPLALAMAAAAAVVVPKAKAIAPVAAAPLAPVVAEEAAAGGSRWWLWLLGLGLLALLAWWFAKGCGKTDATAVAPAAAPKVETPVVAADTAKPKAETVTVTPAVVAAPTAPSCNLNWILFNFDKSNIRADADEELAEMAKILKEHKDYVGVLSAHTDIKGSDAYNEALSERRAANAKAALVKMGIAADRIQTEKSGKKAPVAKNTDDDSGRRFNRRVELYIRDKAGKDICQSVAPAIPTELKAQ